MMEKKRVFENKTKILQGFYDFHGNLITLKPGETYVEDLSKYQDVPALVMNDFRNKQTEAAIDEQKRVNKKLKAVKEAKTEEELDALKEGEHNNEVLEAILARYKGREGMEGKSNDPGGAKR